VISGIQGLRFKNKDGESLRQIWINFNTENITDLAVSMSTD